MYHRILTTLQALVARHPLTAPRLQTTYLAAGPLDPITAAIQPYATGFIALGVVILGACICWAAVKMGARGAIAGKGDKGGVRDSMASIFVILLAAAILGGGAIFLGIASKIGAATHPAG